MTEYAYEIYVSRDNIRAVFKTDDLEAALRFACDCEEEGYCFDFIDGYTGEVLWNNKDGEDLYITQEMRLIYAGFKALQN